MNPKVWLDHKTRDVEAAMNRLNHQIGLAEEMGFKVQIIQVLDRDQVRHGPAGFRIEGVAHEGEEERVLRAEKLPPGFHATIAASVIKEKALEPIPHRNDATMRGQLPQSTAPTTGGSMPIQRLSQDDALFTIQDALKGYTYGEACDLLQAARQRIDATARQSIVIDQSVREMDRLCDQERRAKLAETSRHP